MNIISTAGSVVKCPVAIVQDGKDVCFQNPDGELTLGEGHTYETALKATLNVLASMYAQGGAV